MPPSAGAAEAAEQHEQIVHVDQQVSVEIRREVATRLPERGQQLQQVVDIHEQVSGHVAEAFYRFGLRHCSVAGDRDGDLLVARGAVIAARAGKDVRAGRLKKVYL